MIDDLILVCGSCDSTDVRVTDSYGLDDGGAIDDIECGACGEVGHHVQPAGLRPGRIEGDFAVV